RDWWASPGGPPPAAAHEPAALEHANADARTRAASEPGRITRDVERQPMQAAQRSRYGQRKLRSGAEPGMGRNDLVDPHIVSASKTERAPHRLDVAHDPFPFGAGPPHLRRGPNGYARLGAFDGEADAAEASAESAVEIQKAEMQPCRSSHGDIGRQWSRTQPFSPEVFSQTGFFEPGDGNKLRHLARVGNLRRNPAHVISRMARHDRTQQRSHLLGCRSQRATPA